MELLYDLLICMRLKERPVRASTGGYGQQGYRPPHGSGGPPQWGQRGSHFGHPTAYDYQHRGPYPSHNQPYPPAPYRNYPQHMAPRSGYGSGWEQRPHRAILEDPLCGGDNISLGKDTL
ncbi:hypothetical protein Ahy_A06g026714 [Arachis hypogaea]|uniref:Uncharacterized protein n=1 Tax=Arachis hypogaea TaxID=3818 RepID=A0A445CLD5_ARAHY|nr:hypothetical protein Ahy_A06g026714 [Arachis hypogaea]